MSSLFHSSILTNSGCFVCLNFWYHYKSISHYNRYYLNSLLPYLVTKQKIILIDIASPFHARLALQSEAYINATHRRLIYFRVCIIFLIIITYCLFFCINQHIVGNYIMVIPYIYTYVNHLYILYLSVRYQKRFPLYLGKGRL